MRAAARRGHGAHRMGSCSWTSRKVRPLAAAPSRPSPLASLAPSARSCCSSFSDSERPVPSYLPRPRPLSRSFGACAAAA